MIEYSGNPLNLSSIVKLVIPILLNVIGSQSLNWIAYNTAGLFLSNPLVLLEHSGQPSGSLAPLLRSYIRWSCLVTPSYPQPNQLHLNFCD